MDFNAHMRNTGYLDTAVDVRLMYFAENGFPSSEFERLRLVVPPEAITDLLKALPRTEDYEEMAPLQKR